MATYLTASMDVAEDALAENADFRAWCGASSAADAKANYIFSENSVDIDSLPASGKYGVIGEVNGWGYNRVGEGSGSGNFLVEAGIITVTFQEALAKDEDWSAATRIAFKDFVWGQLQPFVDAYESGAVAAGAGFRLMSVRHVPFGEDSYRLRVLMEDIGRNGYMYAWELEIGIR